MTADDCPVCTRRWPAADHRITDLGQSIAYRHEDQFVRGWTVLVLKRHATELLDLRPEERSARIRLIRSRLR